MPVAEPVTPLKFALNFTKIGKQYNRHAPKFAPDEFIDDPERRASLPIVPDGFTPLEGDLPTVAARADQLNEAQLRSGFLNYFFFPDTVTPEDKPLHCNVCGRVAAREASADE
ncbi:MULTISPECIES: hypothetical protein [Microbacterium]|uniref:Uncharacterized protein n=1 Tax=Microbacterium binotii TaxID=462710 RepID=A0ABN3PED0_9MICO|nr:hypothetical protein [Microbacterium sp. BG28]MDY0829076.1 hypothetical protein [Microbacterium sp. BG28]